MTAKFILSGLHEPVIELKPQTEDERILLAAFLRYDANVFSAYVERYDNGHIERVEMRASQSN